MIQKLPKLIINPYIYILKQKHMKDYNNLTQMQKLVSKAMNCYRDEDFVEMVQLLDEPEYWQELIIDDLDDAACEYILSRLLSMYRDWNCA